MRLHTENQLPGLPGNALNVSMVEWVLVEPAALCGHTNFVFGLKLGCDNTELKSIYITNECRVAQQQCGR